jgi:hypothetical protein
MFYCQITKKMSQPGDKLHKVVVERRERVYTRTVVDKETRQEMVEEIGRGWEIVKEVNATEEGARLYAEWQNEKDNP